MLNLDKVLRGTFYLKITQTTTNIIFEMFEDVKS